MKKFIAKRILFLIPILLAVSFLTFVLVNLGGSDPAEVALRVNDITPTEEAVESMRVQLGLDRPFLERYVVWVSNCLHGDFGKSYVDNKPVAESVARALPNTLKLSAVSLLLILVFSMAMGVLCAKYEGSIGDRIARTLIFLGTAMPGFWAGLLLIWVFSVKLDLFPTSGMYEWKSIVLPSVTLSLSYISTYTRLIRNNMCQNKRENYVMYLRVRGMKERTITRHIFKNSLQTSLTALGMSIPKLIAGTVVVENIFAWPGIGRLCVTAIFNRDYPVIQAYVLLMAVLFVVCNLLADIFCMAIDPRLSHE